MPSLNLGIGGRAGLYTGGSTGAGGVGSGQVFASPITGDLTTASNTPLDHPAAWVLIAAGVWIGIVYFHFHMY